MGKIFLTPKQLSERWDGSPSVGTLSNWRYFGVGPRYVKLGNGGKNSSIKYAVSEIEKYERKLIRANHKKNNKTGRPKLHY